MTAVLALRIHELFPPLAVLRPGLLTVALGGGLLALNTSGKTFREAVAYAPSKWVLAYLAWAALTVPTALWQGQAVASLTGLAFGICVYWAYAFCGPAEATYLRLSRWLVWLAALFCMGVIARGQYSSAGRLESGGAFDPNDLAALVAVCLPFAVALLLRSTSGARKWLSILPIFPLIMTLILTGSRGGIVATFAGMVVLVFGFKGIRRVKFLAAAGLVVLLGWQMAGPTFQDRMASFLSLEADYNVEADEGRLEVWKRGIGYVQDRPITGVGIGNFGIAEGQALLAADLATDRAGKWSAAHNSYVQAFADLGIPGGFILLGLLGSISFRAARWWRSAGRRAGVHRPELLSAMVAFVVGATFLSHAYFNGLFAIMGLVALADRTAARQVSWAGQRSTVVPVGGARNLRVAAMSSGVSRRPGRRLRSQ